jgi:putative transposase
MIDRTHELPVARQAPLVGISRGAVYYMPRSLSAADLRLMRRIGELHMAYPLLGARLLRDTINRDGFAVGRKHMTTMMRRMGIKPLYRKPSTSKKYPGHAEYPYLLRGVAIERTNRVWAMDITYIPIVKGFVCMAAVVDWASRRVLAHRVSITMDTDFCVQAVEEALAKCGQPEIFNTDQGSQLTSQAFTQLLAGRGIRISMDGKGAWRLVSQLSVFVERLWRTIKHDEVYLKAYESVSQARASLARFIEFHNARRPQSSLDRKTPDEFYFTSLPALKNAA